MAAFVDYQDGFTRPSELLSEEDALRLTEWTRGRSAGFPTHEFIASLHGEEGEAQRLDRMLRCGRSESRAKPARYRRPEKAG